MEGITYLIDEDNNKKFVQIDLEKYGDLVEDLLDILTAKARKNDSTRPFDEVVKEMKKEDLIDEWL
ncbi:MAG TPA: hypothetical protein PKD18_18775 [Saprospiraceae bacterium]|nr:hypothetical protein [Saprospiraceae bacterium]